MVDPIHMLSWPYSVTELTLFSYWADPIQLRSCELLSNKTFLHDWILLHSTQYLDERVLFHHQRACVNLNGIALFLLLLSLPWCTFYVHLRIIRSPRYSFKTDKHSNIHKILFCGNVWCTCTSIEGLMHTHMHTNSHNTHTLETQTHIYTPMHAYVCTHTHTHTRTCTHIPHTHI